MSEKRFITSVFYYVPEDQEDGAEYNAFPIYKKLEDIRLTDVRESFPIPGKYHFRFQHLYKHDMLVWLDLNNENCPLPTIEDQIIVKALRLSWKTDLGSQANEKNKQVPKSRNSEPEEHKDLDGLMGGDTSDSHQSNVTPHTRHSHVPNQKQEPLDKDPFEGIDFSMF